MDLPTQPIVRSNLHDTLLTHLLEPIVKGELRSGDKLPEQLLCNAHVLDTTVRITLDTIDRLPAAGSDVARPWSSHQKE